jgi:proteasome accessory factor A
MQRRIFGIETEFGVTCTFHGQRRLSPDEVARYLFRRVVSWGRSSNVFLRNGSRLYLDVGSHPEYATAECDDLVQLVTHDKAGERILEDLLVDAERRLADEGIGGDIFLFKNNTDSAGNSYGCHENYLVTRAGEFSRIADVLLPFLVTRQLICGAGKVLQTPRGAERYRRLHVIVGDSNMAEATTLLKVGSANLVLEMIEDGVQFRDFSLDNPIRAIREISHDLTGRRLVRLAGGREASALDIQREYFSRAVEHVAGRGPDPVADRVIELWGRTLDAVEAQDLSRIDREIDWAIKHRLVERYQAKHSMELSSPRIAQLDLAYHDIRRGRGIFDLLQRKDLVARVTEDGEIEAAKDTPPQTTRAKLRGDFIAAAQQAGRDFTVDWVHLKLNDQAQRTVLCKDPFRSVDERVERLIASL